MTSKQIDRERRDLMEKSGSVVREYLNTSAQLLELNARFLQATLREAGLPATSSRLVFRCCCRDTEHMDDFPRLVDDFKKKFPGTIDSVLFDTASHTVYIFGTIEPKHEKATAGKAGTKNRN